MKLEFKSEGGQSLIEVLIGLSIGAILIGAASLGVVFILRSSTATQYLQSGTQLSQDLVDRVRSVSAATWQDLYNLTEGTSNFYFVTASGTEQIIVEGKEGVLSNEIFDGLVGHWNFDEATSTATTTTFDTSGQGNHGTLTNSPSRATSTCKVSHCLDFDGTDDYIAIADNAVTIAEDLPWTLSLWINPDSFSNYDGLFGNALSAGAYQRLQFDGSGNIIVEDKDNSGGGVTYKVLHGMSTGNWYHVAVVNDGSDSDNITFYVDATSKGTTTMALTEWEVRMIGGRGGSDHKFDGKIDDVRIYNRALSADEVQRLWNSTVFTRYFTVENVSRDSSGNIVTSGGNDDPSTQKTTAYVEWPGAAGATGQVDVVDYVTRWVNDVFSQSDWSGGDGDSSILTEPNNRYSNATSVSNPAGSIKIEGL